MIHATGIPFFNPLLSMGGVPFPWTLPTQGTSSPPSSPPSSPVSNTSVWHRPQPARAASFTIDAILGRHQQETEHAVNRSLAIRREERLSRSAPYPTIGDQAGNGVGSSSSSSSSSASSSKAKVKRVRTIFTAEQLERLEAEFARQQYMVGPERLYLAAALNLTEAQVKVWFQNRRIKWRKQYMEQQHAKLAGGGNGNSSDSVSMMHSEDDSGGESSLLLPPHADDRISPLMDMPPVSPPPSPPNNITADKDDSLLLHDEVVQPHEANPITSSSNPSPHKKRHHSDLQNALVAAANAAGGSVGGYPSYLAATLTAAYAEHQSEPADLTTTPK